MLQLDAHADLRDGYLGERYSHAAAMRRVLDHAGVSLVSVGIRAISKGEVDFAEANRDRITIHWARDRARWDVEEIVAPLKGRPVYVTFDIDALDSSVMPATGTPTPGGLSFDQALAILRRCVRGRGTWSAPTSSSWRRLRGCTPATTPPPCSPTSCSRMRCPIRNRRPRARSA